MPLVVQMTSIKFHSFHVMGWNHT